MQCQPPPKKKKRRRRRLCLLQSREKRRKRAWEKKGLQSREDAMSVGKKRTLPTAVLKMLCLPKEKTLPPVYFNFILLFCILFYLWLLQSREAECNPSRESFGLWLLQSREAACIVNRKYLKFVCCSHEAAMSAENRFDFDLCKVMKM